MANKKFSEFTSQTDSANVQFVVGYNGSDNVRISPSNLLGAYLPLAGGTMSGNTIHGDNVKSLYGTGSDLEIYHDATDSYIVNETGHFYIRNNSDDKDIIFQTDDGGGGIDTYFQILGQYNRMQFNKNIRSIDNAKITFGSSDDLEIYHDGTDSYIAEIGTGDLIIRASNDLRLQSASGEAYLTGNENDGVEIYYDNAKKFETTSTGVSVTGTLSVSAADSVTIADYILHSGDDSKFGFPSNDNFKIRLASSDVLNINSSGNVGIGTTSPDEKLHILDTTGANIILNSDAVAANSGVYMSEGGDATPTQNGAYVYYDGTNNLFKIDTGSSTLSTRLAITRDTGNVGIGTAAPTAKLQVVGLAEHADNSAATTAGLTAGAFYRTGDLLKVVH